MDFVKNNVFKCFDINGLSYTAFGLICTKVLKDIFNEFRLQCEITRLRGQTTSFLTPTDKSKCRVEDTKYSTVEFNK